MPAQQLEERHERILGRYCEHIRNGKAVLLVGSGVSVPPPSSRPTWAGFVDRMADFADRYSKNLSATMKELASEGKLLAAADLFIAGDKVPKRERANFFIQEFDTRRDHVPDVCRDLAALDINVIVTTNFDNNLRYALDGTEVTLHSNEERDLQAAYSFLNRGKTIIQLHGRATVYDSLVYTSETFRRISSLKVYRELLRHIFSRHAVLAVGYSFSDPPFLDALKFVADELGGLPAASHVAILPSSGSAKADLLAKAGFESILYDSSNGHDYLATCVRKLRTCRAPADARDTGLEHSGGAEDLGALVSAFLSITNPDRGSTYDTAAAALVLTELSEGSSRTESAVKQQVSLRMRMSPAATEGLVVRGLEYLRESNQAVKDDGGWRRIGSHSESDSPALMVEAVVTRMKAIDRLVKDEPELSSSVRGCVTHLMMAQGMAAARSFLNIDSPDLYALQRLVKSAVEGSLVAGRWRRTLEQALMEVLREPTPGISRELFKLANAAFALETVFLNPHGVDLGQALRWKVYLDSNVLLRILDESGESGSGFREFHDRLRRLHASMYVLGPFAEEVVGNVRLVGEQLKTAGATSPELALRMGEGIPPQQRSPIYNWYAWGLRRHNWKTYDEFKARKNLADLALFTKLLQGMGIETEGYDAIRRYDSSERETLWSDLREWRGHDPDSKVGRRLRRAEATQVIHLAHLRAAHEKAWFVSIDGQLRRALKYVSNGQYAGYVMTPAAWLLRLNTLHWGEVDVSGFSELMWAVPRSGATDRIKGMVMTRVLQVEPELKGEGPDWLRDRVDDEFERFGSLIPGAVDTSDSEKEEEEIINDLANQIVEPTAHRILDELARRRRD